MSADTSEHRAEPVFLDSDQIVCRECGYDVAKALRENRAAIDVQCPECGEFVRFKGRYSVLTSSFRPVRTTLIAAASPLAYVIYVTYCSLTGFRDWKTELTLSAIGMAALPVIFAFWMSRSHLPRREFVSRGVPVTLRIAVYSLVVVGGRYWVWLWLGV